MEEKNKDEVSYKRENGENIVDPNAIKSCNQILYPQMKAENPMESRDPNVDLSKYNKGGKGND